MAEVLATLKQNGPPPHTPTIEPTPLTTAQPSGPSAVVLAAAAYLRDHPDTASLSVRKLTEVDIPGHGKVGKSTWAKAKKLNA